MIWLFFYRVCVSNEHICVRFVLTHDLSPDLGMSTMMDAAYCPSWAFRSNLIFGGILVAQFIAYYVLFCGSLFVFCSFSFLHVCCLSFDMLGLVTQMLFLDCPYTYMYIQWFLIFNDLRWEVIMKRKCKQLLSTMPSISTKWVITSHWPQNNTTTYDVRNQVSCFEQATKSLIAVALLAITCKQFVQNISIEERL